VRASLSDQDSERERERERESESERESEKREMRSLICAVKKPKYIVKA